MGDLGDLYGEVGPVVAAVVEWCSSLRNARGESGRTTGDVNPTKGLFSGRSGRAYSEGLYSEGVEAFFVGANDREVAKAGSSDTN